MTDEAGADWELLLFPEINVVHRTGETWRLRNVAPALDLFASWNGDRFRLLGEALLSEHEQHIERLQVGFRLSDTYTHRIGRFHTPS